MVVAYADRGQAAAVVDAINEVDTHWIEVNDTVVVRRDKKGRLRVAEPRQVPTGGTIPWSALWRWLLQTSTFPCPEGSSGSRPAGGVGIPETFVEAARKKIENGDSALIVWLRTTLPAGVVDCLKLPRMDMLRAPLTATQDALLHSVLDVLGPVARDELTRR